MSMKNVYNEYAPLMFSGPSHIRPGALKWDVANGKGTGGPVFVTSYRLHCHGASQHRWVRYVRTKHMCFLYTGTLTLH